MARRKTVRPRVVSTAPPADTLAEPLEKYGLTTAASIKGQAKRTKAGWRGGLNALEVRLETVSPLDPPALSHRTEPKTPTGDAGQVRSLPNPAEADPKLQEYKDRLEKCEKKLEKSKLQAAEFKSALEHLTSCGITKSLELVQLAQQLAGENEKLRRELEKCHERRASGHGEIAILLEVLFPNIEFLSDSIPVLMDEIPRKDRVLQMVKEIALGQCLVPRDSVKNAPGYYEMSFPIEKKGPGGRLYFGKCRDGNYRVFITVKEDDKKQTRHIAVLRKHPLK